MSDNDEFQDDKAAILGRKIEELEALLEQTKAASTVSNIPVLDDLVEYEEESVVPAASPDRFTPKITLPDPQLDMPTFTALQAESEPSTAEITATPLESQTATEPGHHSDSDNTEEPTTSLPGTNDVDSILQQIEAKITHDLDTLVEILKDTIKDSVMTEIKTYLANDDKPSSKTED